MIFGTQLKIISGLVVIVLIFGYIMSLQLLKIQRLQKERGQAIKFANTAGDSAIHYRNKAGRMTAKAEILELTLRNAKELMGDERLSFVKQFDGVKKDLRNLQMAISSEADLNAKWRLEDQDTVYHKIINGRDSSFQEKFKSYKDSLNSVRIMHDSIKIHIVVPIQEAVYWQRYKKFIGIRYGRKKWFSDLVSTNPFVTIRKHQVIRVQKLK